MMLLDDENMTVSPMLREFYEEAGFRLVWISVEEHERGIGESVGWNAVRVVQSMSGFQIRYYTPQEALQDIAIYKLVYKYG